MMQATDTGNDVGSTLFDLSRNLLYKSPTFILFYSVIYSSLWTLGGGLEEFDDCPRQWKDASGGRSGSNGMADYLPILPFNPKRATVWLQFPLGLEVR